MLLQDDSSFLLVSAPEPASMKQAERFFQRLKGEDLPVGGMIVNRVHNAPGPDSPAAASLEEIQRLASGCSDEAIDIPLDERLLQSYREQHALAQADNYAINHTRVAQQRIAIHSVPHFERDLHSLEDIQAFADKLISN